MTREECRVGQQVQFSRECRPAFRGKRAYVIVVTNNYAVVRSSERIAGFFEWHCPYTYLIPVDLSPLQEKIQAYCQEELGHAS